MKSLVYFVTAVVGTGPAIAVAEPILYTLNNGPELRTVNQATGVTSVIGSFGLPNWYSP